MSLLNVAYIDGSQLGIRYSLILMCSVLHAIVIIDILLLFLLSETKIPTLRKLTACSINS